jgi:hypothetical protein
MLVDDVVLGEQILGPCHGFEFEVVPARILEEHGPLLPGHALEPQVRGDDEADSVIVQAPCQCVELVHREGQSKMWDRNFVAVHRVDVVDAPVVTPDPVADDLVPVQRIVLPPLGRPPFSAAEDDPVKVPGLLERMHRERVVEGRARRGVGQPLEFDPVIHGTTTTTSDRSYKLTDDIKVFVAFMQSGREAIRPQTVPTGAWSSMFALHAKEAHYE